MEVNTPFCCRKPWIDSGTVKVDSYNVTAIIDSFRCRGSCAGKVNRSKATSLLCYITMLNAQRILKQAHLLAHIIDIQHFCCWYAGKVNIGIGKRSKRRSRNHWTNGVQECG